MSITDLLGILGGLSLFLYGMNVMSEGLEEMMSHRLEIFLMHLTDHKLKAICLGMLLTAIMQSSSAMTVILISFLNVGLLPLQNAIWVMMGANIGTTITGMMIAFQIGAVAPLLAFIGTLLILVHCSRYGKVILGLGLLFMGLEMMSLSLEPLKNSSFFLAFTQSFSHPFLGICIGAIFTAIIQSSSAAIGILENLAKVGLVSFHQSVFFIFGFDIGTCITAFIASLSGTTQAKKLALFHVSFNMIGTVFFTILCYMSPLIEWIEIIIPNQIMFQIALMHTLFNIGTTILTYFIDEYLIRFINSLYFQ